MDAFDSAFARRLAGKIEHDVARRTAVLLDGKASDIAEYRAQVEGLKVLGAVRAMMTETHRELTSPDPLKKRIA